MLEWLAVIGDGTGDFSERDAIGASSQEQTRDKANEKRDGTVPIHRGNPGRKEEE
jgi:hypothetical protein